MDPTRPRRAPAPRTADVRANQDMELPSMPHGSPRLSASAGSVAGVGHDDSSLARVLGLVDEQGVSGIDRDVRAD